MGRRAAGILVTAVLVLALAPAAQGAITGSQVTKPKDPRYLTYDEDTPNTIGIRGTTSGGNPATDEVDLVCFHGDEHGTVAEGVALAGDGTFRVRGDLSTIDFYVCHLRA